MKSNWWHLFSQSDLFNSMGVLHARRGIAHTAVIRVMNPNDDFGSTGETYLELCSEMFMAACYLSLLIVTIALWRSSRKHGETPRIKQLFWSMVVVNSFARTLWFGIPDFVYGDTFRPTDSVGDDSVSCTLARFAMQFLHSVAEASFFTSYLIIVYFWASTYSVWQLNTGEQHRTPLLAADSAPRSPRLAVVRVSHPVDSGQWLYDLPRAKTFFILANVVVWGAKLAEDVLFFVSSYYLVVFFNALVCAVVSVLSIIGFTTYGFALWMSLRPLGDPSQTQTRENNVVPASPSQRGHASQVGCGHVQYHRRNSSEYSLYRKIDGSSNSQTRTHNSFVSVPSSDLATRDVRFLSDAYASANLPPPVTSAPAATSALTSALTSGLTASLPVPYACLHAPPSVSVVSSRPLRGSLPRFNFGQPGFAAYAYGSHAEDFMSSAMLHGAESFSASHRSGRDLLCNSYTDSEGELSSSVRDDPHFSPLSGPPPSLVLSTGSPLLSHHGLMPTTDGDARFNFTGRPFPARDSIVTVTSFGGCSTQSDGYTPHADTVAIAQAKMKNIRFVALVCVVGFLVRVFLSVVELVLVWRGELGVLTRTLRTWL